MPPIRSLALSYYFQLVLLVLFISKIMPLCSYCIKKNLVCIIIIAPFSRQPSFYLEYIKLNIYSFCNIRLVSNAKYIFLVSPSPSFRWKYLVVYSISSFILDFLKSLTPLSKLFQGPRFNPPLNTLRVNWLRFL